MWVIERKSTVGKEWAEVCQCRTKTWASLVEAALKTRYRSDSFRIVDLRSSKCLDNPVRSKQSAGTLIDPMPNLTANGL